MDLILLLVFICLVIFITKDTVVPRPLAWKSMLPL